MFLDLAPFANPPIRVGLADRFSFQRHPLLIITTLPVIRERSAPRLRWRAVVGGVLVALTVALLARLTLAPTPGLVATILGVGLGAFLAGKWANSAGLYHGAMVGVGYVVLEALGVAPSPSYATDVLADTAIVIAIDALLLLVASAGGWIAQRGPSSSSDTDRVR